MADDTPSFADRFADTRKANLPSHAARVRARRSFQPAIPFDDPPADEPPEGFSPVEVQPQGDAASTKAAPPEGRPHFSAGTTAKASPLAAVPDSGEKPPSEGLPKSGGTMHEIPIGEIATGEKAKARDILTAIRTLKAVEREQRPPTDDEMQALRRFGGFGAVALHIFPDPQTSLFKDGWQEIGRELQSLLTPVEYDSAKRTTFSQFFTSPIVMSAMHSALSRLGVPSEGVVLEPGCGCIQGDALIGISLPGKGTKRGNCKKVRLADVCERFHGTARQYNWNPAFPVYVQREQDGFIRLAKLRDVWCSGVKETFTLSTTSGREVRATAEHPFLTERGWVKLANLKVGDLVHVHGARSNSGPLSRPQYTRVFGMQYHPYANRFKNGSAMVPQHRLVAEAYLNGLSYEAFLDRLAQPESLGPRGRCADGTWAPVEKTPALKGLSFLDPKVWAVHHDDHDTRNNALSNLRVLTHEEHRAAHTPDITPACLSRVAIEGVASITPYGHEMTYDISVEDDPHNFLANGFVVHNSGRFMTGDHRYIGVELDSVSARIARALHPKADIRCEDFQKTKLPPLDAVIGNVPFANIPIEYDGKNLSLHDFFIAKSLDALKPGGVMAVVTSHYTLDKQTGTAREAMAAKADFLGAIRLPSDAFKREGTAVVTDIVFLRKREPGQEPKHADPAWLETGPLNVGDANVAVNRYFLNHPEMVLGQWSRKYTLYGGEGFSVTSSGDLATQLRIAVGKLPRFEPMRSEAQSSKPPPSGDEKYPSVANGSGSVPPFVPPPPLKHISEGSFFVHDKRIHQMVNGTAEPVVYGGGELWAGGALNGRRMAELIELRDLTRRVLQSQNEGWPEAAREEARRNLNRAYDRFHSAYGPVNKTTITATKDDGQIRRMPNLVKFREDPDAMLVMALEEYDEATGKAQKAAILLRDVVGPRPPVTRVTTAEEGLLVSLDHKGEVNIGYIAGLYGKPGAVVISELGDLIYQDPVTHNWQTADEYLSGNVRVKLTQAEKAGPAYAHNAAALRQVQPEDVLPGDIDANLGAPWIPASDVRAFAADLFGVPTDAVKVTHLKKDALWSLEPDYRTLNSVAATADYGTSRINGTALLELALNLKTPAIYDTVYEGGKETRVLNPTETLAAKEKQRQIKEKFKAWIFADPDRTERLVRDYNDAFNNLRPRLFDGSHLDFPGMSKAIELRQSQKDAIWRGMTGGNTLLAHVVGGGKTWIIAATAMKMRQTGLAKKPIVVVPNHCLEQFGREFLQLYPNAKLLIASKEDFTEERRKLLTAKIATGDWDAVIVTHSSFERMGMSPDFQERFLREQIGEYESLLIDKSPKGRNILKTLEKQKAAREAKLKALLAEDKKDSGVVFDELGIDQIMVDECFTYDTMIATDRGLLRIGDIVTKMLRVKVKSVNTLTKAVEWKPVVNWYANKRRHPLVEIIHEKGSVRCTAHHKLFNEQFAHRQAGQVEAGEALLVLPEAVSPHESLRVEELAEVLLSGMLDQRPDADGELRNLRDRVHFLDPRPGQPSQTPPSVLLRELQDEVTAGQPGQRGTVPQVDAARLGRRNDVVEGNAVPVQGEKAARVGGKNAGPQALGRNAGEAVTHLEGDESPSPDSGWQRETPHGTPGLAGRIDRYAHRASDSHEVHPAPNGQPGQALQGRPGRPSPEAGGGGGRQRPQLAAGERTGREEGQSVIPSRVVSVTLLEPGSDGEYRFGGRDHSVVYDIEVADNHNYFANGLLVSNCHAYKNLETPTKMERVAGIQTGGSERAFDLLMKAKYLDELHPGHGLIGASGTPISNSMVEMFTLQRLFDPKGLKDRGIDHFDGWAATFGEVVEAMEISPDGATLKPRSRFAKFVNLPELVQMFRAYADVQTADMLNLPRPALEGGKPQTVACPMSDEQHALQAKLIEWYEKIRNERVDPRVDNALAITTDGRKLALDARLLSPGSEDFTGSKVNALVGNVRRIWERTAETRGTQMVFCDMGVHAKPHSVYDDIVAKLVARGIPAGQIAIMGDADTDAKKQALFEKVRQGTVRVLIGSTSKMGTGTNVQKRLVALHHLDAPWKPAEVEQRDGRILRQGNTNPEVSIYRYVTEGSFDAYMWQALETKAKFIAQVMTGDCAVRKAEDVGGQELSYAEVKAIASGNPAVLTLAETDAELQRLAILRKNHHDEQYLARRNLKELPGRITNLASRIEKLGMDMGTLEAHGGDRVTVGNRTLTNAEAVEALTARLERLPQQVSETRSVPMGTYRGLPFGVYLHPFGDLEAYLDGHITRRTELRDGAGGRALLNALERLAGGYGLERERCEQDKSLAEGQLGDYQGRLGAVFRHADYEWRLIELRDKLKAGLSEKTPEPKEGEPTVAELDAQIKALRASNAVDAAPARIGAKPAARAERPVTARIARPVQVQAEPEDSPTPVAAEQVKSVESEDPPASADVIPMPTRPAFKPVASHTQHASRRKGGNGQMSLFD